MPRESGHDRLYVGDRHTSVTPAEQRQPARTGRPRAAFEPRARTIQTLLAGQRHAARRGRGARGDDDWNCGDACTDSSVCVFSRDVTPVPKPGVGSLMLWSGRARWAPCSAPGTRQGALPPGGWQQRPAKDGECRSPASRETESFTAETRGTQRADEAGLNSSALICNFRVSAVKVSVVMFLHERRAPAETWDAQ